MSRSNQKQTRPAIPAAWAVRTPENKLTTRGNVPQMSDQELRDWSAEQAATDGIHPAALEAAKRGITLAVFDQQTNTSYPYRPELKEQFRMKATELLGLYGQDLDDYVAQGSEAQAA